MDDRLNTILDVMSPLLDAEIEDASSDGTNVIVRFSIVSNLSPSVSYPFEVEDIHVTSFVREEVRKVESALRVLQSLEN